MKRDIPQNSNSDQVDRVIFDYLDEVLCDPETDSVNKDALAQLLARSALLRKEDSNIEVEPRVASEVVIVKEPSVDSTQKIDTSIDKPLQTVPIPEWAQQSFECLIFNVAGLKLAVPLIMLGAVFDVDRKFHSLPGQQDWFVGILQTTNAGNIKVLDTAKHIMPERYQKTFRDNIKFVVSIYGRSWGLACHSVEQSLTLRPEQVKWRSTRGKRPWLAGTIVEHMCSLIDTDGFQQIIEQSERQISPSTPLK